MVQRCDARRGLVARMAGVALAPGAMGPTVGSTMGSTVDTVEPMAAAAVGGVETANGSDAGSEGSEGSEGSGSADGDGGGDGREVVVVPVEVPFAVFHSLLNFLYTDRLHTPNHRLQPLCSLAVEYGVERLV